VRVSLLHQKGKYWRCRCLKARQLNQYQQCNTHHTGQMCWYMIEVADEPMCFAKGLAVVKGDPSTAVFRGSNVHLGRRTDQFLLARSQTSLCIQLDINSHTGSTAGFQHKLVFATSSCMKTKFLRCVFRWQLNTDVFRFVPKERGPAGSSVVPVLSSWFPDYREHNINYSSLLISRSNSAWVATHRRSSQTHRRTWCPYTACRGGTLTPQLDESTNTHPQAGKLTFIYRHNAHSAHSARWAASLCTALAKNGLRGRDYWFCNKVGFPHRDTP